MFMLLTTKTRRRRLATNLGKGNELASNRRFATDAVREQNIIEGVGCAEYDLHFKVEEKEESLPLPSHHGCIDKHM